MSFVVNVPGTPNEQFRVWWTHYSAGTTCVITRGEKGAKYDTYERVAICNSTRNPKDAPWKHKGRMVSLTRALQHLYPSESEREAQKVVKEMRKTFWDAYHAMMHKSYPVDRRTKMQTVKPESGQSQPEYIQAELIAQL